VYPRRQSPGDVHPAALDADEDNVPGTFVLFKDLMRHPCKRPVDACLVEDKCFFF
jgi:hypothetical protein